jgi:PIN domain nuclease of toxin-antitoxin system
MYLVDACALIAVKDPNRKKPRWIVELFDDRPELLRVSAVTVWEIEIKAAGRSATLPRYWEPDHASARDQLMAAGIDLVDFDAAMATRAARLPPHHNDPFDRGMIAAALILALPIISFDRMLRHYDGIEVCWERPPGV